MIFIYLIILLSIGESFLIILDKTKIISTKKLNGYERLALSMSSSFLVYVVYLFIIGLLGIKITIYLFIPLFINAIFQLIRLSVKLIQKCRRGGQWPSAFIVISQLPIIVIECIIA